MKIPQFSTSAIPRAVPTAVVLAVLSSVFPLVPPALPQSADELRRVEAFLERDDAASALALLGETMNPKRPAAEALLLRSTARFMIGATAEGSKDLERALELDPNLRQGWLNLAGLEIAEGHYEAAEKALEKARSLDPDDPDNHLNLGAVTLFQDRLDDAQEHFAKYLAGHPDSADAAFLVAANYALSGHEVEAVRYLRRAVGQDERKRLEARSDERFVGLQSPEYRKLLRTDTYKPPEDALTAAAAFAVPYERQDPKLVYAVLEALKAHEIHYDPWIEATDAWALVWAPMRIKIFTQENGTGVVSLSAPPDAFAEDDWQRRTQELFRTIYRELGARPGG